MSDVRYGVFSSHNKDEFEKLISNALSIGYEAVGGICVETTGNGMCLQRNYHQAMIKVKS